MPKEVENTLVGATLVKIRPLTQMEIGAYGWDDKFVTALEFDNGDVVFASRDDEGNGAGTLFCFNKDRGEYSSLHITEKEASA